MFGLFKKDKGTDVKTSKSKIESVRASELTKEKFAVAKSNKLAENTSNLAIVCLSNYSDRIYNVNAEINNLMKTKNVNYVIQINPVKFSNGEGKVKLEESVRGKDVYIISDVSNYSITYKMYGYENHMSPDEHFQDIIRTISAMAGKPQRITLIMPLLYSARQHRRQGRESLDCAMALRQIESLGIDSIITFDAHDPNIQNVLPTSSFDSIFPLFPVIKQFVIENKSNLSSDKMVVISPDNGAMARAITYASMLKLNVGMFYKRRDYTKIVNGKNPIVSHEYNGPSVDGKDVLIIDDMIASGESMVDVARELKARGAKNVISICTFAFFTEGLEKFDNYVKEGLIKQIYCTNASFISEEMKKRDWLKVVELESFVGLIISTLHKNESLGPLINSTERLKDLLLEKI